METSMSQVAVQAEIIAQCEAIKEQLLAKNKAYGNAALDPVRIFSKADAVEQIKVRLDDKLSRLARGSDAGEDVMFDLIGYLILMRVTIAMESTKHPQTAPQEEEPPSRGFAPPLKS